MNEKPSPKVKVTVWADLGSEALLIVRKHLHLKLHNIKSGLTGRGGCNIHRSGARWMDRFLFFFIPHADFHIWVIKFIIWPTATLACDYPQYPTERSIFNFGEQREITVVT